MEATGDPLPYGIEPNCQAIQAPILHAREQGIVSRTFAADELVTAGSS